MEAVADLKLTLLLLFAAILSLVLVPSAQATTTDVKYCGQFHIYIFFFHCYWVPSYQSPGLLKYLILIS